MKQKHETFFLAVICIIYDMLNSFWEYFRWLDFFFEKFHFWKFLKLIQWTSNFNPKISYCDNKLLLGFIGKILNFNISLYFLWVLIEISQLMWCTIKPNLSKLQNLQSQTTKSQKILLKPLNLFQSSISVII